MGEGGEGAACGVSAGWRAQDRYARGNNYDVAREGNGTRDGGQRASGLRDQRIVEGREEARKQARVGWLQALQ